MATNQHQVRAEGQFSSHRLREKPALRGKQYDGYLACTKLLFYRFHCLEDGFGLEHHARSPAIGVVVGSMMFIMGVVANIVNRDVHKSLLPSTLDDALVEWRGKRFWKETQNIETHGIPQ